MGYRKFNLVNNNNATFTLTEQNNKVFGGAPTGLGYSKSTSLMRVGNDNIITYSQYEMIPKELDIVFWGETPEIIYKQYKDFVKFLVVEPLYLLYTTPETKTTYRIKVTVASLEKTEIDHETSTLTCGLSLTPLSFWEDNIANVIQLSNLTQDDGKQYPLERPYSYAEMNINNVEINCKGTLESPLEIRIDGNSVNPQWNLTDENGNLYGRASFIGTYDNVYVNSDEANESITLESGGAEIINPYNYQDLSVGSPDTILVTFLRVKPLEKSNLSFILSAGFSGDVTITWRNRYVSV